MLSEIVDGGFFTEHSLDWRGRGVAVSYSGAVSGAGEGATVTVPAKGEATVGVDIVPGFEFAQYVADNAPSGTFLDGFVRFTSRTESQPSLSVPYLGFYGDWGKPAIFDALASDGKGHMRASGLYDGETGTPLGFNPRPATQRATRATRRLRVRDFPGRGLGRTPGPRTAHGHVARRAHPDDHLHERGWGSGRVLRAAPELEIRVRSAHDGGVVG